MISRKIFYVIMALYISAVCGCSNDSGAANATDAAVSSIYAMEPFVLNLSDPSQVKFTKVTVALDMASIELVDRAKARNAQLRDSFIVLISNKRSEDLITAEGKAFLKDEMNNRANQILSKGAVKNTYFTDFVMQ